MATEDSEGAALTRLLAALSEGEGAPLPTSALGRMRRTATAAARAGTSHLLGRLRGRPEADAEAIQRLVLSLGQLKGVAMKMGQILSYIDASTPPELRQLLAVLQKSSQPTPFAVVEQVLREELGDRATRLLETLERRPVATASIGQVHRGRLEDGRPVAVKVLHPGIADAIRSDFRSAQTGKAMVKLIAPGSNASDLVDEAERMFLEECDYALEASRQRRFGGLYAEHLELAIPEVFSELSSSRVLTTAWSEGMGWEELLGTASPQARNRAGRALYTFYVGTLYRHGLFNGDPHPGNLLFTSDGAVTVLDFGCVREFSPQEVEQLRALSRAVRADDPERVAEAFTRLGGREPTTPAQRETTRRLLRGFFGPVLSPGARRIDNRDFLQVAEVLRNKRAMLQLRIPGKLLFPFRIRFGLHALLARLGAEVDWAALEEEFAGPADRPPR
ncbi:MAG: AarF/ABC1/UbiB kinase family protein [Myxococcota bacterium]|nr:AarF/ABC1/UbiB kinase family protein [Myxococcota bacterium]